MYRVLCCLLIGLSAVVATEITTLPGPVMASGNLYEFVDRDGSTTFDPGGFYLCLTTENAGDSLSGIYAVTCPGAIAPGAVLAYYGSICKFLATTSADDHIAQGTVLRNCLVFKGISGGSVVVERRMVKSTTTPNQIFGFWRNVSTNSSHQGQLSAPFESTFLDFAAKGFAFSYQPTIQVDELFFQVNPNGRTRIAVDDLLVAQLEVVVDPSDQRLTLDSNITPISRLRAQARSLPPDGQRQQFLKYNDALRGYDSFHFTSKDSQIAAPLKSEIFDGTLMSTSTNPGLPDPR